MTLQRHIKGAKGLPLSKRRKASEMSAALNFSSHSLIVPRSNDYYGQMDLSEGSKYKRGSNLSTLNNHKLKIDLLLVGFGSLCQNLKAKYGETDPESKKFGDRLTLFVDLM